MKQWRKEYQDKLDRDNRDVENKRKLNQETAIELANQIKQKQQLEHQHKLAQQKLVEERVQELEQAKKEMAEMQKQKLIQLQKKKEECIKAYEEHQARKEAELKKERASDKQFIQAVLEKEKAEAQKEALKQQGLRSDIHGYVQYLDRLKKEEKEKEKALNELRQQELEKAWQKRQIRWDKEALARKQLLEQVYLEREDQVAYRNMIREKSKNEDVSGAKESLEKLKLADVEEQKKQEQRLAYNKEIQNYLKQQMNEKESIKKQERESVKEIDAQMKQQQKEYEKLIRMEAEKDEKAIRQGRTTHHYPKQTANWWTF